MGAWGRWDLPLGVVSADPGQAVAWEDFRLELVLEALLLTVLPHPAVLLERVERLLVVLAPQVLPEPLAAKVQHHLLPVVREAPVVLEPHLLHPEHLWQEVPVERQRQARLLQAAPHRPHPVLRLLPQVPVALHLLELPAELAWLEPQPLLLMCQPPLPPLTG